MISLTEGEKSDETQDKREQALSVQRTLIKDVYLKLSQPDIVSSFSSLHKS